jgi:hypothetical protein
MMNSPIAATPLDPTSGIIQEVSHIELNAVAMPPRRGGEVVTGVIPIDINEW